MYLRHEITPEHSPRYLVIREARSTGAQEIVYVSDDLATAEGVARAGGDRVLRLAWSADFRQDGAGR